MSSNGRGPCDGYGPEKVTTTAVAELHSRIIAKILAGPYGSPIIMVKSLSCRHGKHRWEDCVDCAMIDMAKDIEELEL